MSGMAAPPAAAAAAASAEASAGTAPELEEEMFIKLLEHSDDLFSLGTGSECEFESAAGPRKLGFSRLGAVELRNIHPDDRAEAAADFVRCLAQAAASGAPVSHRRVTRLLTGADRTGPPLWFDLRLTALPGGKWYIMGHDVSEAKLAERSLHDWLATMSHDARTPLSSINASCTLLAACALCAEARELLAAVAGGTHVLLSTVNQVMLLRKLDSEGGAAAVCAPGTGPADVDVARLARGVLASVTAGLAAQTGVRCSLELDAGLAPRLACPREHVEHILLSLLVYGVQAGTAAPGDRSVSVRIWCERRVQPGGDGGNDGEEQHMLVMRATVPGRVLTPQQLAVLFDPFTSATRAEDDAGGTPRADAGGGSGRLGLHVARRLARALGGKLVARSTPGEGSSFVAELPAPACCADAEAAARHDACCARVAASAEEDDGESRVDADEPRARRLSEERARASQSEPAAAATAAGFKAQLLEGDEPLSAFSSIVETNAPASGERFGALKLVHGKLREMMDLLLAHADGEGFLAVRDGVTVYMSQTLARMLRYNSQAELMGMTTLELTHPDDLERVVLILQGARAESCAAGGTTVRRTLTSRMRRGDGTYVWVESEMCIDPRDSYNILRDVTDRKRLSASLKSFLALTVQDMLQPVTLVQTASQLLSQLPSVRDNEEARFLVAAVSAASRLLSGIVSNVLSLRALEAGECSINAAPFSVREAVDGVLSVCDATFAAHTLRWVDQGEQLPARALGDGDRMAQILLNLLTNAAKFADGTEVTISVRVEPRGGDNADAAAALTIVVADGGRGMSAEECTHAFEPYYRAPSHRGGGTGLGLYVCKRLSEAMGGSVAVRSAPGQGATFTVQVPLQLMPDECDDAAVGGEDEAAAGAAVESPSALQVSPSAESRPPPLLLHAVSGGFAAMDLLESPAPGRGVPSPVRARRRVLLADDHNLNLRLCKKLLEAKAGMDVVTADDGDVALQWLISSYQPGGPAPVDLVLMDMNMPRMDGLEATRQFRRWESEHRPHVPRLPIVALTANVFDEAMAECTAAGMDAFAAKPLRIDLLRATLATRLSI